MSYVSPRAKTEDLEAKLQAWAEQDVVDEDRLRQAFDSATASYYRRFLRRLDRHVKHGERRLLDVGCSTGQLLAVAREEGWQGSGLEIGRESAKYAYRELGLDVKQGSLYSYDFGTERFNAVAMIEVIEHLEDPAQALGRIRNLLHQDGLLLVTTPNFDSLFRRLFGSGWWVINCEDEHIVLFNIATLRAMLESTGYEIVDWYMQGIDVIGMIRQFKTRRSNSSRKEEVDFIAESTAGASSSGGADGYYESRASLNRAKVILRRLGLISVARGLLRLFSRTFSMRGSPTYALGEQMVVIARKRSQDDAT